MLLSFLVKRENYGAMAILLTDNTDYKNALGKYKSYKKETSVKRGKTKKYFNCDTSKLSLLALNFFLNYTETLKENKFRLPFTESCYRSVKIPKITGLTVLQKLCQSLF